MALWRGVNSLVEKPCFSMGCFCMLREIPIKKMRQKNRMKKNWIYVLVFFVFASCNSEKKKDILSFKDPTIIDGAEGSIIKRIESAVIIPEDFHEDLWVTPTLVTIPGNPIICELVARTTDRKGADKHTIAHYFRTDDFFETLQPVEQPIAKDWNRIGISRKDLIPNEQLGILIPENMGHTQYAEYLDLGGDTILQAFTKKNKNSKQNIVQSLTAKVENGKYKLLHISNSWTNATGRGLYEPQIAEYENKFFMTARAEDGFGYLLVSHDRGKTWDEPVRWRWDNGEEIPMDQTMTKLIAHSDGLVFVYTRKRDDNTQTFRHRAPLHVADFDTETLTLKRNTERIIVPNKGLAVGNFWVWTISPEESYVVTAEWPRDGREANGDIWLSKIKWNAPNKKVADDGSKFDH